MNVPPSALHALAAGGVVAAFLVAAGTAPATPGNGAVRIPEDNQPFDIPAEDCGFPIHVGIVEDKEYVIHSTTLADGTVVERVTGSLFQTYTNTNTGKSVVANVGGPATVTTYPDGSALFDGQGHSAGWFDPSSQARTGEPGLVFTSGHVVALFDASGEGESVTFTGQQTNGCAALS
jgi:hypothetical protein